MVELLVLVALLMMVIVCGYVLYRRHNREPLNPTIARQSKPRRPGTGLFGDQSGFGP